MTTGLPFAPWHMWGSTERLSVIRGAVPSTQGSQLARINYKRPETWRFLIAARLVGGDAATNLAGDTFRVNVNLNVGLGRSSIDTKQQPPSFPPLVNFGFVTFDFLVPLGTVPGRQAGNNKYTDTGQSPPLSDIAATPQVEPIDRIVAQDIQVYCELQSISAAPGATVSAEVSAYFAPNVHIRPDWFRDTEEERSFLGLETGGT
jgi:hypothetical protein